MSTNTVFPIILGALVALLMILVIIAAVRMARDKKKAPDSVPDRKEGPAVPRAPETDLRSRDEEKVLKGSLAAKIITEESDEAGKTAAQIRDLHSVDEHYAHTHGQWVCPYCETLNGNELSFCQACGQPRA